MGEEEEVDAERWRRAGHTEAAKARRLGAHPRVL
jgi:hypothetical protein